MDLYASLANVQNRPTFLASLPDHMTNIVHNNNLCSNDIIYNSQPNGREIYPLTETSNGAGSSCGPTSTEFIQRMVFTRLWLPCQVLKMDAEKLQRSEEELVELALQQHYVQQPMTLTGALEPMKEELKRLYLDEDRPLHEIMGLMEKKGIKAR
jgi:hypothetical protein